MFPTLRSSGAPWPTSRTSQTASLSSRVMSQTRNTAPSCWNSVSCGTSTHSSSSPAGGGEAQQLLPNDWISDVLYLVIGSLPGQMAEFCQTLNWCISLSEPPFELKIAVLESLNVVLLEDVGSLMSLLSNCKIYYGPMTGKKIEKKWQKSACR